MAKKVVNLATEEYVDEKINGIGIIQGPAGDAGAVLRRAEQGRCEENDPWPGRSDGPPGHSGCFGGPAAHRRRR